MSAQERREKMLEYIKGYIERNGYSPTVREIQVACGLGSTATVQYNLEQMRKTGQVTWIPGLTRTLRVV